MYLTHISNSGTISWEAHPDDGDNKYRLQYLDLFITTSE
jgi:hypothetical protein